MDAEEFSDESLQEQVETVRRRLREQMEASVHPAAAATGAAAAEPIEPSGPVTAASAAPSADLAPRPLQDGAEKRIAIGADHGGYELKCRLVELLGELGYEPLDLGTHSSQSVDYPDFAIAVARSVARGEAWRGIMIDGAGIGSAMAANKVTGIRAATCHNEATVVNRREHNNANVLVLGSGQVNRGLARRMVRIWLQTPFAGGRHQRRVDKIDMLDRT
jgi:ribose 5-phosphate isomerase B